ncbi:MAG: IclR family transcriptional regulator, partial [Chloroflexota bacterium]|nr:IclR family transcriptional regulator [Chloroflexota bacterium]
STLESRGYVAKDADTHRYRPGARLIGLSTALVAGLDLVSVARPVLEELKSDFGETVNLGVLADGQVLYLDMLESHQGLRTTARPGTRDPLHCTALGKAMLACLPPDEARRTLVASARHPRTPRTLTSLSALQRELSAISARGYAIDDEENEQGARCVGVAVRDATCRPTAALSVSGPVGRLSEVTIARIGERLGQAAREVEARMGYRHNGGM